MAQGLKSRDETRTIDQIRADVFLDLLDGKHRARNGRRGTVDIQVDLTTLARLPEHPGELAGYGLVPLLAGGQKAVSSLPASLAPLCRHHHNIRQRRLPLD